MHLCKLNLASYILPNIDYLFCISAQLTNTIRLASNCYESSKNCLKVMINSLSKSIASTWKTAYYMSIGATVPNGEWFSVVGYINFEDIISNDYLYKNFYILGPKPSINISIDNIELSFPQPSYLFKEEVYDQIVTNRDAKADTYFHPIMLHTNPKAYISIKIRQ